MASITDFEKAYLETRGLNITFRMNKRTSTWVAYELTSKKTFEAKTSFKLFDMIVSYCKENRKESKVKFEL